MTPNPSLHHIPKCRTAEYNPLSFKVTGLGAVAELVGVVALSATAVLAKLAPGVWNPDADPCEL